MGILVGEVECQIKLFGPNKLLSSNIFKLSVTKTLSPSSESSQDQLEVLVNALGELQHIDNRFDEIQSQLSLIDTSHFQTRNDSDLETNSKTIVGAINELYTLIQTNGGGNNGGNVVYGEIVLSKTSLSLTVGKNNSITVKLDKQPTNNQTVTISSNNSSVTVFPSTLTFTPSNYNITQVVTVNGVSSGNAIITMSSPNVVTKNVSVSVTQNSGSDTVSVTGVTLNRNTLSLNVGESETLSATVLPSNATNKSVTWSSSSSNVRLNCLVRINC
jgi:hypothetical protein